MLTDLLENPNPMAEEGSAADTATADTAESSAGTAAMKATGAPLIVVEEEQLLDVVLRKLDGSAPRRTRVHVDDARQ